ncbi:unnamed protein product [Orchesella dallaii]|uniref:HMG box domain-containing protein n=1 Tax=Orchesella dallaii TaxID=48710 RepID=A0ABP1QP59_9HEXA
MVSVAGPSKPKKKNGFYVFMEECKLATEDSLGFKLTMSALSLVLSEDWKNMSAEEKEGYASKAKAYNEKMRAGNEQTKLEHAKYLKNVNYNNSDRGDRALYVFAFMSDLEKTRKCLDWIFEAAGCSVPIKVLNLSQYAHLASTVNSLNFRSVNEGEGAATGPVSSATLVTAANRIVGDPLNKCFIYPPAHPMTCYGVFPNEACVDDTVKSSDNYKYYEELCCVYHMKKMKEDDDAILEERAMKERHQRRQRRLLERQLREESQRKQVEDCQQSQEAQIRFTEEWRSQNEKRQEAKRLWPWATQ